MDIKYLKIKDLDIYSMVFSGLLYIGLGILFLTRKETLIFAAKGLLNLLAILFIIAAIFQIIGFSSKRHKRLTAISRVWGFLINMMMAAIIYLKPALVFSVFPLAFGLYALVSGLIRLLVFMQYKKNKVKRRKFVLVEAIILVFWGVLIILNPLGYILPISNIVGVFFVFYGITFMIDGILEGTSVETKNSLKRRVRISLPVFMVALIPHQVLKKINEALETDDLEPEDFEAHKGNRPYDLEILIHVGPKGPSAFGHVDIWFEGRVMTYGGYDEATYKLKGLISEGVLMEVQSKEKYIEFSQRHLGKTLFGFGLTLTPEQKDRVRGEIKQIYASLYEWYPRSKEAEKQGLLLKKPYDDYASITYDNLNARYYKFKKGRFKTYFILNTNCVLLADRIVGQAGIDLVSVKGLITPGAYFEYFNREFSKRNSFVISRTIYHKAETNIQPESS